MEGYANAAVARCFEKAGERLLAFYAFPKPMWKSLRTTNSIENLNREKAGRRSNEASRPLHLKADPLA